MKIKYLSFLLLSALLLMSGCSNADYAESGTLIVEADEVSALMDAGYMLLDAQKNSSYGKGHVKGTANIERAAITVNEPVANSLAPAAKVAEAASAAGLSETDNILIYDSNANMDSSRLYWTLLYYGHKGDIRLVSGGLSALKAEGFEISKSPASVRSSVYKTGTARSEMMIDTKALAKKLDDDSARIIDVRSDDEYYEGTIPGSIHINFTNNNFKDSSFKPVQQIRILYKEHGIMPEDEVIMFCKTSIRAANTYAALYNAGYRNLKIYDAAWLGWERSGRRIYTPEKPGVLSLTVQDNS